MCTAVSPGFGSRPGCEVIYMNKSIFNTFLIKYAEIAIKGNNRYIFEDALVAHINAAMKTIPGRYHTRKTPGRIFLECSDDNGGGKYDFDTVVDKLTHIFGIVHICPVVVSEDEGEELLREKSVNYWRDMYGDDASFTFKVQCRRGKKNYPLNSMEISADVGEAIIGAFPGMKVDVHKPDKFLNVEIRDKVYLYSESIPGPGGMPVGTGGKGMLLLSGGIDSPVAGYMISKRGVSVDAVYFNAPPYTSERAKQKVIDLAKIISAYTGPINLHIINFTDIQLAIYEKCPHDELTIIMRRYMMRIAEHLAYENGCQCLVTGESVGQVASQTLHSLVSTNEVCTLPVLRPLIAFDKQDIVEISEKIDTYETSILPYEDCCTIFVAKHPVTHPLVNVIRKHELLLADVIDDLLAKAYETDEIIEIGK